MKKSSRLSIGYILTLLPTYDYVLGDDAICGLFWEGKRVKTGTVSMYEVKFNIRSYTPEGVKTSENSVGIIQMQRLRLEECLKSSYVIGSSRSKDLWSSHTFGE